MTALVFSDSPPPTLQEGTTPPLARHEPELPARPRRINPHRMFVGSFVPDWLLCRVEISQGAKLCYARLAQFAGKDGECFPKQETLAGELGISERQTRAYLTELGEFALIETTQHGLGTSNSYTFLDHAWIHDGQPAMPAVGLPDRQSPSGPTREKNQSTTHKPRTPSGLPCNESEAVEAAKLVGIPDDFARAEFNRMEAVNWIDGCQRAVSKWPQYLKQRWAKEQSERAERAARVTARPSRNGAFIPPRKYDPANYQQPVEEF